MPSMFAFIKKFLLENTYQVFLLKCGWQGKFSFLAKILPSVSDMIHPNFFTLMAEKKHILS